MAKTSTQRVEALRARRREQGYKLYQEWLTPEEKEAIKAFLKKLRMRK